jgi:two-component system phosphate regulon response regulator PhoB
MDTVFTTKDTARTPAANARLNVRILLVHDGLGGMRLASDALKMQGYVVEQASNERAVNLLLGSLIPSLILLDFSLPGIDRLARKLRSNRKLRHVPIIALASTALNGGNGAHAAGCDGCIIGPVDIRKLPLQVAAFLVRGAGRSTGKDAT